MKLNAAFNGGSDLERGPSRDFRCARARRIKNKSVTTIPVTVNVSQSMLIKGD